MKSIASIRANPFQMKKKIIALFLFLVHEKLRSEAKKNLRERERETYRESEDFAGLFLETKKASEGEGEGERESE